MNKLIGILSVGGGIAKPAQDKTVTPNETIQTVVADDGYDLETVTVNSIPTSYGNVSVVGINTLKIE